MKTTVRDTGAGTISRPVTLDELAAAEDPLHVFAYGSLLWRPGFPYISMQRARLYGFHRALRVWSVHHRGTEEQPGLVLGLDRGGSCTGGLFEIRATDRSEVAAYLWEREMVTSVYVPRMVRVHVIDDDDAETRPAPRLSALCFLLDREHEQYAGTLNPSDAAAIVSGAKGCSGHNHEYVRETLRGLRRAGIDDEGLARVDRLLDT